MILKKSLFLIINCLILIFLINSLSSEINNDFNGKTELIEENNSVQIDNSDNNLEMFVDLTNIEVKSLFKRKIITVESVKNEILNNIGEEKLNHDFGNLISITLTKEEIEDIRTNVGVKDIVPVGKKEILLQDSNRLINSTLVWPIQINNINLTGKGQTVCIIDSGVNYNHPALGGCYGENNFSSSCKIIGGWDFCPNDIDCSSGSSDSNPIDVNGHGTHVAGIVAANGTITGVAPEAKIVMIKASNASGTFWDDDIIAAINWCVDNATKFNISVISMSLGAGAYIDYCDNEPIESFFAEPINNAIAKNISVVVAAGNDGYYNAISSPACIQNATPISATTKQDNIANYADTNFLVELLAPGGSESSPSAFINSTCIDNNYCGKQGTSMATPHAAGAIAVLNEYLSLTSKSKTPSEIEDILNSTGKSIIDSEYSNLTFSRINLYEAVKILDDQSPNVTLLDIDNENYSLIKTFRCNVTDFLLKNITFYLWDSNNNLINSTGIETSSNFYDFSINITNLENKDYTWNCLAYDLNNNYAFAEYNSSLNLAKHPTWCALHFGHTLFSDGTMTHEQQVENIKQYYDCGGTSDHDTSLNQTEWENSINSVNTNNTENFTYFFGTEWTGSQHIYYITLNYSEIAKSASQDDFNTVQELTDWLYNHLGVGQYVHPARSAGGTDFSDSSKYNQTVIPLIEIVNQGMWHWNYYWNCSNNSGCNTYVNPKITGLQSASAKGWVKYALDRGLHLGFSCGNDYHGSYPYTPKCYTGLTNVYDYSQSNVLETLTNRHTWVAEDKILMNLIVNNGSSNYTMGDIFNYSSTSPTILINYSINATSNKYIKNVSLFYNGVIVNLTSFNNEQNVSASFVQILDENKESYIFIEATQSDGNRSWTSPFWVYYNKIISNQNPNSGGSSSTIAKPQIYTATEKELSSDLGYGKNIAVNDKIYFSINNQNHTLILNKTYSNSILLTIQSEVQYINLSLHEEKKLKVNSADYFDLYIKLNSIFNNKANITIKKIYEPIINVKNNSNSASINNETITDSPLKVDGYRKVYIIIFAIIIILLIVYLYAYKKLITNNQNESTKSKSSRK